MTERFRPGSNKAQKMKYILHIVPCSTLVIFCCLWVCLKLIGSQLIGKQHMYVPVN